MNECAHCPNNRVTRLTQQADKSKEDVAKKHKNEMIKNQGVNVTQNKEGWASNKILRKK